ncbi:MAG: hypothetical protein L0346_31180 [Chloroflexi bacterium]|nr:hypothetical protein [Chloroflexota bacterium]
MQRDPKQIREKIKRWLPSFAFEYGLPLAFYTLLAIAISWPAARDLTSKLVGRQAHDVLHHVWVIWRVKEVVLGRQPLFYAPLLYYPTGISILFNSTGPLIGLFALPFWPWGPIAAYNGTVLIELTLSGYCMYLLARSLGFTRPVAIFAGTFLLVAPLHLGGLLIAHLEKVFIGLFPLVLLALGHALNLERSRRWTIFIGITLLSTLLHNGLHFVIAFFSVAFFMVVALIQALPSERRLLLNRFLLIGISLVIFVAPLLFSVAQTSYNPFVPVDVNLESTLFQPDLAELFMPPSFTRLGGSMREQLDWAGQIQSGVETNVYIPWTILLLSLAAVAGRQKRLLPWALFSLAWVVLSLGPSLQILGRRHFTEYGLPVTLPYAFLTALPGLDFLRTPGRLMLMGYVGLGILACFGLAWVCQRFPKRAAFIVTLITGFMLLETWPQPWPQSSLPTVPDFYRQIAGDDEVYGVFDLPIQPNSTYWMYVRQASYYQFFQMTHHKGIPSGYLSRVYSGSPIFPCLIPSWSQPELMVNGRPADCVANALYDLAANNYRYVVWHKPASNFIEYVPGSWGEQVSAEFIQRTFANQEPLVDDTLVTVYAVPPITATNPAPTISLMHNWYDPQGELRWAISPGSLYLFVPQAQEAVLHVTLAAVFDPAESSGYGQSGQFRIALDDEFLTTVTMAVGETMALPLHLPAGAHSLVLELEAGNFHPVSRGGEDRRELGFAIHQVDLELK